MVKPGQGVKRILSYATHDERELLAADQPFLEAHPHCRHLPHGQCVVTLMIKKQVYNEDVTFDISTKES